MNPVDKIGERGSPFWEKQDLKIYDCKFLRSFLSELISNVNYKAVFKIFFGLDFVVILKRNFTTFFIFYGNS